MPILTWNAGAVIGSTMDKVEKGMTLAVIYVESEAKGLMDTSNDHGEFPSAPGEPPHVGIGTLRANVSHSVKRDGQTIEGFVGVRENVKYARRLELGFVGVDSLGRHYDQAPRPFLRPALLRSRDKIVSLIAGGGK